MALKELPISKDDDTLAPYKGYGDNREQAEVVFDRIYVGGLGQNIGDEDLYHFFSKFGHVKHVGIITENRFTKGYGFVTFSCKDVVRRLLEEEEGANLVLNGRRLNIGPARQRFRLTGRGFNSSWGGRGAGGWRGQDENYSSQAEGPSGEDPTGEDPTKSSPENLSPGASQPFHDDVSHPEAMHPGQVGPMLANNCTTYQYDTSADVSCCTQDNLVYPYSLPTYPIYYPQFQAMSTPNQDMSYYPITYQDQVPQDTYTTIPASSPPTYQVPYQQPQGSYPLVPQSDQAHTTPAPYWPQAPFYPVYYSYPQHPTMLQYSYTGDSTNQPVLGYQDPALSLHDSQAYQGYPGVPPAAAPTTYQGCQSGDGDNTGYSEANELLTDSGYQDTSGGVFQDTSHTFQGHQPDQHFQQVDVTMQQVECSVEKSQDCRLQIKTTGKSSSKVPHSSTPEQQNSANPNQEQQMFTKLRAADNTSRWDGQATNFRPPGRGDNRFYPSKNFAPFNGSPAPRHFPFGPRPYYPDHGGQRGRGRAWGMGYNRGGEQGGKVDRILQKKKPAKKGAMGDSKVAEKAVDENAINLAKKEVVGDGGLTGSQPDLLQGPLEKLEIK